MQKSNKLNRVQREFILKHKLTDINLLKTIIPVEEEAILKFLEGIDVVGGQGRSHNYPKTRKFTPHPQLTWTDKELEFLRANSKILSLEDLAFNLGRTVNSVIGKAYREGIDLLTRRGVTKYE